jgi:hypothetical protein
MLLGSPPFDAPPNSLMDLTTSLKVKIMEGEVVRTHSFTHNTSGIKGRAGALKWD